MKEQLLSLKSSPSLQESSKLNHLRSKKRGMSKSISTKSYRLFLHITLPFLWCFALASAGLALWSATIYDDGVSELENIRLVDLFRSSTLEAADLSLFFAFLTLSFRFSSSPPKSTYETDSHFPYLSASILYAFTGIASLIWTVILFILSFTKNPNPTKGQLLVPQQDILGRIISPSGVVIQASTL